MNHSRYPPEGSNSREPKVAIPRIPGQNYQIPPSTRTPRARSEVVSKACTQCRKRKIKCSGARPRCDNCDKHHHSCHYDLERKDRLKGAQRKSHALTELLLDLSSQLDEASQKRIEETLASFEDDTPPPPPTPALSRGKRARRASSSHANDDARSTTSAEGGEAHVSASVGSNEDLDFVQEDILRTEDADNTGYMGRNSQVQWLRALESKIEHPERESSDLPYGPPGAEGDAFNQRAKALRGRQQHGDNRQSPDNDQFLGYYFYLDKSNIDIDIGDPHVIPSADTADRLFEYYKAVVHSTFPILGDIFEHQLHVFFTRNQNSATLVVCPKWKAVMNLVFAIGARYSHLIGAEWRADDHDHLVYMWRAVHLLQLQSINTLVAQPDQTTIQAFGLLSLYYLTIGHVSRAWYMIGIAIRHAQAAGLHLRHEDPSMSPERRKDLARIWWSLYSIECVLTSITGRPRTVNAIDCTVPPPGAKGTEMETPLRETPISSAVSRVSESSASGTVPNASVDPFDVAYVRLDILMDKILSGLYSAQKSAKSWKAAQKGIASLSDELEAWALRSLSRGPAAAAAATSGHDLSREQLLLYLYYHNAKICITRPCLCRLDLRIKGQSEESIRFNQKTAEACIGAQDFQSPYNTSRMQPSPLANPLATVAQLETSGSQLDGIPSDLEDSIRFAGARLTQAAGILLRLPQEVVAQAIVVSMRFWLGPEGGSLAEFGAEQVSAASLYLTTKLSAYPKSARSLVNVYAYLDSLPVTYFDGDHLEQSKDAARYYVSEGTYERRRATLFTTEQRILRTLGFNVAVQLPYTLCITYMQALDIFSHLRASELAKRAIAHLNTALLSPQCLYLTHQPPALATAAIYLAARETGIKMPECEWWEVFDTDREVLGFLCVGMLSLEGFAREEQKRWEGRKCPMSVEALEREIERRKEEEVDEA